MLGLLSMAPLSIVFGMWGNLKALRRCQELEEQVQKLRREFLELQLDWSNSYDKLKTMMQRVAKRAEVVQRYQQHEEEEAAPTFSANEQLMLNRLPPHQRRIQEQILLRRKAANGGA